MRSDQPPKDPIAGEVFGEIADERILHAAEKRARDRLVHDFEVPIRIREVRLHVDPEGWRTGFLAVRERDTFAPEMLADLHELTPQALLRDLYRPVRPSVWHEREVRVQLDEGGRRALAEARAVALKREPLPRIEPTARAMTEAQARRREFLSERWQPARPDDAPRETRSAIPDFDLTER